MAENIFGRQCGAYVVTEFYDAGVFQLIVIVKCE